MIKKKVFIPTLCLLIGVSIGSHLPEVQTTDVKSIGEKNYNSQVAFYDNMIKDVNTVEVYDSSELTFEILTNRNGNVVIEKVIGEVTNYKLDGKVLNCSADSGDYITYKRVENAKEGDKILTYFIYNPFTNAEDDVLTRLDFIIDDNSI